MIWQAIFPLFFSYLILMLLTVLLALDGSCHYSLDYIFLAGYIEYDEEADNQARVHFLVRREDLYRLDRVTPDEERVIISLLRNYGGLFADYGYIDEGFVAQQAGLTQPQTYDTLKALAGRRLIDFIPRKQVPYIRYMQRREDKAYIHLSREIYEDRVEQYRLRIQAMLRYAQGAHRCRSRQLLAYFGETDAKDCHQCDVCLANEGRLVTRQGQQDACQKIATLLADKKRHHLTELLRLQVPTEELDAALAHLVQEEKVFQEDGFIELA